MLRFALFVGLSLALREESGRLSLDRDADGYVIDSDPCSSPRGSDYCQASVQAELRKLQGVEDPGARIGAILALQDEGAVEDNLRRLTDRCQNEHQRTTLRQRDGSRGHRFAARLHSGILAAALNTEQLIQKAASAGATIIASKDYHPPDHCSFAGEENCLNQKDKREGTAKERYVNDFPSHCSFEWTNGTAVPQKAPETPFCKFMDSIEVKVPFCGQHDFVGTDFDPALAEALARVDRSQVEVVFKGFHQKYDSFSAMEHRETQEGAMSVEDEEIRFTGGYALSTARDDACHGKWDQADCYPTKDELFGSGRRSFAEILEGRRINKTPSSSCQGSFRRIVVTGLVYDFCVKETAIFTRENSPSTEVWVLADLTRPSFDGKPGAPYTTGLCDGQDAENGYCAEGGGTKQWYKRVLQDFVNNDVKVKRLVEPDLELYIRACLSNAQLLSEAVPEMEIGAASPPAPFSLNRVQKLHVAHNDVPPVAGSVEGFTYLEPISFIGSLAGNTCNHHAACHMPGERIA
eukprot:s793_g9.t1